MKQGTISRAEGAAWVVLGPRLQEALREVLASASGARGRVPGREPARGTDDAPAQRTRKQSLSKLAPFADQIGVLPDATVASMAGATREAVQAWRRRKGIPAPREQAPRLRPRKDARVLPLAPDPDEARRRIEAAVAREETEARLAEEAMAGTGRRRRGRPSRIDRFLDLLGVLPDEQVAARAGVALSTVRGWRKARDIPPAELSCEEDGLRPIAPLPRVDRPGSRAFLVTADDESEFVVLAGDLAEAAATAVRDLSERRPGTRVVALDYVADHLGT